MSCSRLLLILAAVGSLTAGEHNGPPPKPSPDALFSHIDTDGDGKLTKAEFAAGLAELGRRNGPPRDGEGQRPPGGPGDGQRPPHGDGQRPPGGPGDGQRPPHGDGPRPPGGPGGQRPPPGGQRPPQSGDGEDGHRPPPSGDGGGDRPKPPSPEERKAAIDAAFAAGDADNSGSLDKAEFGKAMQAMPKPPRPPGDRPQGKPAE